MSDLDRSEQLRQLTNFARNEQGKEELKQETPIYRAIDDVAVQVWCAVHHLHLNSDVCRVDSKQ